MWRARLRIAEALALRPSNLDPCAGTVLIRRGKGGKRRTVGLDPISANRVRRHARVERWASLWSYGVPLLWPFIFSRVWSLFALDSMISL